MKVRLAIGTEDKRYLDRLTNYLELNHLDRLEISSFTRPESFMESVNRSEQDIYLIDESFGVNAEEVSRVGKVLILSESADESEGSETGISKISKYKKPELIFKSVLASYAETGNHPVKGRKKNLQNSNGAKVIMSTSFSGGTGASVFAVACAKRLAAKGLRVLYLSFSELGESSVFFDESASAGSFDDVIFAIKSKNIDLNLKMEAVVSTDHSGVFFFAPSKNALDMLEISASEKKVILESLISSDTYDYIILDEEFRLSKEFISLMAMANRIIVVSNGEKSANSKFVRAKKALELLEKSMDIQVTDDMCILYNRFSSSCSSERIQNPGMPVLGTIPPVTHATLPHVMEFIGKQDAVFENI